MKKQNVKSPKSKNLKLGKKTILTLSINKKDVCRDGIVTMNYYPTLECGGDWSHNRRCLGQTY